MLPLSEQQSGRDMNKVCKAYHEKCIETNDDTHITLLQIRAHPLEPGLPSPAMLLFNHPMQGIMPTVNRTQINSHNNDDHYEALAKRQIRIDNNYDTARNYDLFLIGLL